MKASAYARTCFCFCLFLLGPLLSEAFERKEERAACAETSPLKRAFFGDLHVHTRYSFDSFISSQRNDPWDAYRYAKGEASESARRKFIAACKADGLFRRLGWTNLPGVPDPVLGSSGSVGVTLPLINVAWYLSILGAPSRVGPRDGLADEAQPRFPRPTPTPRPLPPFPKVGVGQPHRHAAHAAVQAASTAGTRTACQPREAPRSPRSGIVWGRNAPRRPGSPT